MIEIVEIWSNDVQNDSVTEDKAGSPPVGPSEAEAGGFSKVRATSAPKRWQAQLGLVSPDSPEKRVSSPSYTSVNNEGP